MYAECLGCGYCCKRLWVVIVDDPEKGISEDNLETYLGDGRCKHLLGNKIGEYSCAIHDKPWYNKTPCFQYTQISNSEDDDCRVGRFLTDNKADYEDNGH